MNPEDSSCRPPSNMSHNYDRAAGDQTPPVRTAASSEATKAFQNEIFSGLGDQVMHVLNKETLPIREMLADIAHGKEVPVHGKYAIMRYKPLHMTDADFAKEIEGLVRTWFRRVADAINTK